MNKPEFREPIFGAPLATLVLPAIIVAVLVLELTLSKSGMAALFDAFGLNPLLLRQGRVELLFSYAFLHGSLVGGLVNALIIMLFGVPLIRAFGGGGWGFVSFLLLFEVTAVTAGLAFCFLHMYENLTVVGASAAASGIMGAAVRLPWRGGDIKLLPFTNPQVVALSAIIVVFHVVSYFSHKGAFTDMAWESHLSAYVIGLVLISPWLHVFHARYFTTS